MRTEDLFKYGVTPKEGEFAGKRFIVDKINKNAVCCYSEDDPKHKEEFSHGTYDLWRPPKTLFESSEVECTLDNLAKAVSAERLGPDTRIYVRNPGFFFSDLLDSASAKIIEVNGKKAILFY